jgi:hypothetical protein
MREDRMTRVFRLLKRLVPVHVVLSLALLVGVAGAGWSLSLRQPRNDLVVPGVRFVDVQYRGLSQQQLTYRLPPRGGLTLLHRQLVFQGWQHDTVMDVDGTRVYRRDHLAGLLRETVRVERHGAIVRVGVIFCIWRVGCG